MKKSSFDVEVLNVPTQSRREMENGTEGFKAHGQGCRFGEVDSQLLCKALRNILHFVLGHLTRIVPLPLTDEFAFEESSSIGDQQTRHKNENLEVFKAV